MGTSKPNKGVHHKTPFVPTWLDDDEGQKQQKPPPERFRTARTRYTHYLGDGEAGMLTGAISSYIEQGTGGSKNAMYKMGGARMATRNILLLLQDIIATNPSDALKKQGVKELSGKDTIDIYSDLLEAICEDQHGGPIDQAIARDAWIKATIALCEDDTVKHGKPSEEQLEFILTEFISTSIEDRIKHDIGMRSLEVPDSIKDIQSRDEQLHDYILKIAEGVVSDQLPNIKKCSKKKISSIADSLYQAIFDLLKDNKGE